ALNNDIHHWEFVGDLDFGGTGSEYMIECPNIIFVKGKPVLLYSPQGLDKNELDYQNIYPNTYKIGQYFDANSSKIVEPSPIYNLDYGFEAYATQGFNTSDGRAFIVSWIGLPDIDYPSDQFDYQGAMSLVKELSIKNGNLYQYPVPAMKNLRQHQAEFKTQLQTNNTYELELLVPRNDLSSFVLFANPKGQGLSITIDTAKGKVIVDRSQAGQQYATEFGTSRQCDIPKDATSINIFIDKSIFEIFINKGEKVFTGRVFPDAEQSGIQLKEGHVHGKYFELKY
ncbi:TPA: GH32 C-terminal domain-containing protein, partial [Streptococcus agalactiae]